MNDSKTPVMMLQEYCVKRKIQVPYFEDLPEELYEGGKKVFSVQVSAVGKSVIGKGTNKKNAKHAAAAQLLKQIGERVNYNPELIVDEKQSAITSLLDLCIQRELPIAQFEDIQAYGPSHCPEFTVRCSIASLVREATAPTKKLAKTRAATAMLQVLQEMQMNNPEELKLMEIKTAMQIEEEKEEDVIRTYREFKKLENKRQPGVRLCDRHNFWINQDPEKVALAKQYLKNKDETPPERINLAMHALKVKFQIKDVPSYEGKLVAFEIDHKDYECFFVSPEHSFWMDLNEYFQIMLNIDC